MTEIEKLLVRVAQGVSGGRTSPVGTQVVDFAGSLDWKDWDALHMVASQLENGEYKASEAPSVEQRLAALEKRLEGYEGYKECVDGLPTIETVCESPAVNDMVREVMTEYMQEDNGWKDYLRDLVSKATDDVDLDSYVDTYLRDKGVERYMDPVALRNEIELVVAEILSGAAALAGKAKNLPGFPRRIGGKS